MKIVKFGYAKADNFKISKHNIRKTGADIDLDSLADSIQNFVILKPVAIDEENEVVDGQRRVSSINKIKERCGKEVLVPYLQYEFKDDEEKLLFSLISNERRTSTGISDKGEAILLLREKDYTLEQLEKLTGTSARVLSSYVGHVKTDKEIAEKHPEVKDVATTISDRRKRVLKIISKFPPYSEDIRELTKLWNRANDMTLRELQTLEKDVKTRMPIDTEFRTTKTIDKGLRTRLLFYPLKKDYKLATERCEAEGMDIQKVALALIRAWANHEIDVDISDDL